MEYHEHLKALSRDEPALASELGGVRTLEQVLAWMQRRDFGLSGLDLVTQDEFNHDLLIALDPGGRYLVFGVT